MRKQTGILAAVLVLACMVVPQAIWAQSELQSRHFTTSDDIELHYLEAGSGSTLVFVPGGSMPASIWEPQLEHFAASHRVVALDPRGQGRSEKPTHGYHPTRRARDICELLEHLRIEPGIVVGWSLAVKEVLVYAQEFGTEAIRAAVLVDYPIKIDDPASTLRDEFKAVQVDRENWTREWVRGMFRSEQSDEYLEAIIQAVLATPTNATAIMYANTILMGPSDLRPALDALDRPVLYVVRGNAADRAENMRRRKPGLRVEVFENVGHALFVDKPKRFNRVLEEFLASLPEE